MNSDITLCKNTECLRKHSCYRYTASPNAEWQSYAMFNEDENGECNHYWKIEPLISEKENGTANTQNAS